MGLVDVRFWGTPILPPCSSAPGHGSHCSSKSSSIFLFTWKATEWSKSEPNSNRNRPHGSKILNRFRSEWSFRSPGVRSSGPGASRCHLAPEWFVDGETVDAGHPKTGQQEDAGGGRMMRWTRHGMSFDHPCRCVHQESTMCGSEEFGFFPLKLAPLFGQHGPLNGWWC